MKEMRGQTSIVIDAPIEVVYDYVLDFIKHPEWNYQPVKVTKTSAGAIGVGSTFETVERAPENTPWLANKLLVPLFTLIIGAKPYTEAEITALTPNQRIAWQARAPVRNGYAMIANWEMVLTRQDNGTHISQRFHYTPQIFIAKMMVNEKLAQQVTEECDRNLARLKGILERGRVLEGIR